ASGVRHGEAMPWRVRGPSQCRQPAPLRRATDGGPGYQPVSTSPLSGVKAAHHVAASMDPETLRTPPSDMATCMASWEVWASRRPHSPPCAVEADGNLGRAWNFELPLSSQRTP